MKNNKGFKRRILASLIVFAMFSPATLSCAAQTQEQTENRSKEQKKKYHFKTDFLKTFNSDIDISYFENDNLLLPGFRYVEVIVNGKTLGVHNVNFVSLNNTIVPCVPTLHIERINLDHEKLPQEFTKNTCIDVETVLPGTMVVYEYDSEQLLINVPQVYLTNLPEGYIDPGRWDNGISALSVNYSLTGSNVNYRDTGESNSMYYGNLFTTLRNGAWRFTTYDSYGGGSKEKKRLNHMQAYAQRAIGSLFSEFSVGDLNTSGEMFNSTLFRGVILQTDDRMHPWSMKGYSPVVRGIANSNAVVTVRQNGNTLYEKPVPPGEFVFKDIVALGYGGDLEVTITESDGSQRMFLVPYSSVPQLLRSGYLRYALATGQIRNYGQSDTPYFLESSLQYGISDGITLYGGLQSVAEQRYSAMNSGMAINTLLGAFSFDASKSFFTDPAAKNQSRSFNSDMLFKVGFSKRIARTDTHLDVASYHLAGQDYFNMNDALSLYKQRQHGNNSWLPDRYRHRLEATLSQLLSPGWGELSLSTRMEKNNESGEYADSRSSYIFGYRNELGAFSYSLNINKAFTSNENSDTTFYFNISAPFGSTIKERPKLRTSLSYSSAETKMRASLNGNQQGEDYSSWINTWFSQSTRTLSNFGMNVGHTGTSLQKSVGYSQGMNYYTASASLGGGLLVHENGVIFSPYVTDTMALIEAHGATGASMLGNNKSKIDHRGYGLVNYIFPYEENMLTLDLKGAPLGFDTEENSKVVVPTSGAVVKVKIEGSNKKSVIRRLKRTDGRYLPFGARLFDQNGSSSATVGQGGIVIFPITGEFQSLLVKWKEEEKELSCTIQPNDESDNDGPDKNVVLICKDNEYKDNNS